MKLSTRVRYGTKAMLDLALQAGEGYVLVKDIALRQGISESYLENLMSLLRLGGLVKAARGAHGGYYLSRTPPEIKLSDIITVLDGPVMLVECLDDPELCFRSFTCVTQDIWRAVNEAVAGVLGSITLEDMVRMQREKDEFFIKRVEVSKA